MAFWPVPDIMADRIFDLKPAWFAARGIRFILLDVDNTLAPYTDNAPSPALAAWARSFRESGIELFILSNNRGQRPELFARALGIGYEKKAWKPFTGAARRVLREKGYSPAETALIGDQIYTDTLCAKSLGAAAALVSPIAFTNPLLRLRYWAEFPFRAAYRMGKR